MCTHMWDEERPARSSRGSTRAEAGESPAVVGRVPGEFRVGVAVEGLFDQPGAKQAWFAGAVTCVDAKRGSVDVKFDDGEEASYRAPSCCIGIADGIAGDASSARA